MLALIRAVLGPARCFASTRDRRHSPCLSKHSDMSLTSVPVRCYGNFSLLRMFQSKSQMSVHERDKSTNVLHQVRCMQRFLDDD